MRPTASRLAALLVALAVVACAATAQSLPPPASPPPAAADAAPAALLEALILHSRGVARLENGRLHGPAAATLRTLGAQAQHVLLGEQHGNQGVADFAAAYWDDLADAGYRHAAVEADPWVAAALERSLRRGGVPAWTRFIATRGGAKAVPFYGWGAEARWVDAVVRHSSGRDGPVLWGLDQVFIGSAAWLLREIAAADGGAGSVQARALAGALAQEAELQPRWLGTVDPARLQALADALATPADADWRALVLAMRDSREIYAPFTGGPGEVWIANTRREDQMRRLFAEHYRRAEAADGRPPRVMLKLGGNHLYRGASPIMVQGVGGFVAEFAAARGQAVLSLLVLCGPGSHASQYEGDPVPCDRHLTEGDLKFLAPYVEAHAVTLFDLRSWRLRQRRLSGLAPDVLRIVASYDLLVFVPTSPGSRVLDAPVR